MIKRILLLSLAISSVSCFAQRKENIYSYFGNLVGTWEMKTMDASIYEEWKVMNDTLMQCTGYKIKNGVKTVTENVNLVYSNGIFYYEPLVAGQNDGLRVVYSGTNLWSTKEMVEGRNAHNKVSIVFVNKNHDYPQYIRYTIEPAKLLAKIGNDESMKEGQTYSYKKLTR